MLEVALALPELRLIGPEDEGEDLAVEGWALAAAASSAPGAPLTPVAFAVIAPPPSPVGRPEPVPEPEISHRQVQPPAAPSLAAAPAVVVTVAIAREERGEQQRDEDHEVDQQHRHDPDLEARDEGLPRAAAHSAPEGLGLARDEARIEAVDQVTRLADFEVPAAMLEQLLQRLLSVDPRQPRRSSEVTERRSALEAA